MERIKAVYGCPGRELEILEWLKSQGANANLCCTAFLIDPNRAFYVLNERIMSVDRYSATAELLEVVDLPRWRANNDKLYYYINYDGTIGSYRDNRSIIDNCLYELGNYFETKENAEVYVKKFYDLFKENRK